jgi:outer membrane immunogenic protein
MDNIWNYKKSVLVALMAFCALASPALSQCDAARFAGAHIGASGGFGRYHANQAVPSNYQYDTSGLSQSGIYGLNFGYATQSKCSVFGVIVDLAKPKFEVREHGYYQLRSNLSSVGTLRAKFGYAFDSTLLFATGGVAITELSHRGFFSITNGATYSRDETWRKKQVGWAFGFGVEHAISQSFSIFSEVVSMGFGTSEYQQPLTALNYSTVYRLRFGDDLITGRTGINWKF